MTTTLPKLLGSTSGGIVKRLTDAEDHQLMNDSVHTQHKDYTKFLDTVAKKEQHVKTMKKKVLVPVEETVKVPVYRKEAKRKTEKVVVHGTKLVPVTKYKEVEETVLDVHEELVSGHKEKRAVPVTRMRQIPYQDFEERIVEVEVEVPADEVVTRKGFRVDTHVVSKVVEVEEDLVYEMRPVLVKRGEKRMKELGDHHAFKAEHGPPQWEDSALEGWKNRPKTPPHRRELHRPSSAESIHSVASSMVVPRLKETKALEDGRIKSPSYFPRQRRYSDPTGAARAGSGRRNSDPSVTSSAFRGIRRPQETPREHPGQRADCLR